MCVQVEQFWRFYSHLVRPGDLSGHSDFHLFKEGIKPMWEVTTCQICLAAFLSVSLSLVCLPCLTLRMSLTAVVGSGLSVFVKVWPVVSGRTSSWPCWGSSLWWERRSAEPWSPYASRYCSATSNTGVLP